ncbi:MAG: hypothetical protein AB7K09_04215 [Planctomycetota bacterium]
MAKAGKKPAKKAKAAKPAPAKAKPAPARAKAGKPAWKTLRHARGAATNVPKLVAQLVNPGPPKQGESPYWLLRDALVGHNGWFQASAPAVSLLLDSAADAADPLPLLTLAADILGGDQIRGWVSPAVEPTNEHALAAHAAAIERRDILLGALTAADGPVRGIAALTIAMVPGLAADSLPLLIRAALDDSDEIARAGALLALGRLGAGNADAEAAIAASRRAGTPPFCRGAAGMAWLRQDAAHRFEQATDELLDWLGDVPAAGASDIALPLFHSPTWFRALEFPDGPAFALGMLARSRGKTGIQSLTTLVPQLAARAAGAAEANLAKIMLDFGGFPTAATPGVTLASELTREQRDIATQLAATHLLPAGGHGLPASGAVRRRWIGLDDAPGPLDRLVSSSDAGEIPLWRAWQTRQPRPDDFASPLDRWQALVEYAYGSYPPFFRGPRLDEVEGEIAALPLDDELVARGTQIADDLAARFAAAGRTGMLVPLFLNQSMLLLQPLIRAGCAMRDTWWPLVYLGLEPQVRDLLQAFSPAARERTLVSHLRGANPAVMWGQGTVGLALFDLAPTPAVVDAIRWLIGEMQTNPFQQPGVAPLSASLAQALERHPQLA